ncbi:unnamed protein product [Rangifer tarandus platyrhynchus]|uniref:Uncharacterized protein n=1 Tax=Rangifer tarandus platyrhynchus TaxID=3082113 RepID=A0AC59Y8X3_RANTA
MLGYVSPVSTCASNTDDVLHVNYLLKSYTSKMQTRMELTVVGSGSSHGPGGTTFVPWFHILAAFRGELTAGWDPPPPTPATTTEALRSPRLPLGPASVPFTLTQGCLSGSPSPWDLLPVM